MAQVTSAQAAKELRRLNEQIQALKEKEAKSSVFQAASGEDIESLRPAYDFLEAQKELDALEKKVREIRHALNVFNTTHTLPGFPEITIDQALVLMPQLSERKEKLRQMAARLPKERIDRYGSNIIDYNIANYDIAVAEKAYEEVSDLLAGLQLALDAANAAETFVIPE